MKPGIPNELGDLLDRAKAELLVRWEKRARREGSGLPAHGIALGNYVPELVDRIIQSLLLFEGEGLEDEELWTGVRRSASMAAPVAEHATLSQALGELALLRSLLEDTWEEAGVLPTHGASRLVHATMDRAMAEIAGIVSLRDGEERYKLALAAANIGTWDYRPATGEMRWDARSREMSGLTADEPVTFTTFLDGIHPDDRPRMESLVAETLSRGASGVYTAEYRILRSDGSQRWIGARGKVIYDDGGLPVRFIGTSVDVTDRQRESEFRERFVGILGHDLRQPLSVINFGAAMLAKNAVLAARETTILNRIARAGDRMSRMIGDLLDFARGRQGGGIPIERSSGDLFAVIRHLLSELETVHADRTFRLSVEGSGEGEWDRDRMAQVFGNLLSNALAYGSEGAPINVVLRGNEADLSVEVKNLGTPIPEPELASLFDPYRRGRGKPHSGNPSGGLGLGLYISREIVMAHGGRIEVESGGDTGTTFRVILPLACATRASDAGCE